MQDYLAGLAHCADADELERMVREQLEFHWRKLNRTDRLVFELIWKSAGDELVTHMTQRQMQEELKLSNSTIRRTIRKLMDLGMLRRIPYHEPDTQGPGANIYVVLPVG